VAVCEALGICTCGSLFAQKFRLLFHSRAPSEFRLTDDIASLSIAETSLDFLLTALPKTLPSQDLHWGGARRALWRQASVGVPESVALIMVAHNAGSESQGEWMPSVSAARLAEQEELPALRIPKAQILYRQ
jgi:hypothetical protein